MPQLPLSRQLLIRECDNPAGWWTAYYERGEAHAGRYGPYVDVWHWADKPMCEDFVRFVKEGDDYDTAAERTKAAEAERKLRVFVQNLTRRETMTRKVYRSAYLHLTAFMLDAYPGCTVATFSEGEPMERGLTTVEAVARDVRDVALAELTFRESNGDLIGWAVVTEHNDDTESVCDYTSNARLNAWWETYEREVIKGEVKETLHLS